MTYCVLRAPIFHQKLKGVYYADFYELMTGKYLTSKTTISKKVNPSKYQIDTYMLVRAWNSLLV